MIKLNFKGQEFVLNHHLAVPFRSMVSDGAKGIDPVPLDGNLTNLQGLKALIPLCASTVDWVFVRSPHKTGNEGWARAS